MAAIAGLRAGMIIVMTVIFIVVFYAILLYWVVPTASATITDTFFDRYEEFLAKGIQTG